MTIEYIACRLIHSNKPIHIVGIYHPPPSSENQTTNMTFINGITDLLAKRITNLDNLMILGNLNIDTGNTTNAENTIFNNTVRAF